MAGGTVAAALAALFGALAWAVLANDVSAFDNKIAASVQSLRNPIVTDFMRFATYLASWQVVVGGLVALIIFLRSAAQRGLWIVTLLIAVIGDEIIVWTTKETFHRVRPDQALALMPATDPSFPSGHTFIALAFYGTLAWFAIVLLRPLWMKLAAGLVCAVLVIAVGVSRVYLGAHWPTDVLGSYLLGGAWLAGVGTVFSRAAAATVLPMPPMTKDKRRLAFALFALWIALVVTMSFVHPGTAQAFMGVGD